MIPSVGQDAKRVALDTSAASLTVAASEPRSVGIRNASAATHCPVCLFLGPRSPAMRQKQPNSVQERTRSGWLRVPHAEKAPPLLVFTDQHRYAPYGDRVLLLVL